MSLSRDRNKIDIDESLVTVDVSVSPVPKGEGRGVSRCRLGRPDGRHSGLTSTQVKQDVP